MSNYGDQFMACPLCGGRAESEAVDVGVGLYIKGDYTCPDCGWEIGGPMDYPPIGMDERPFCPEPMDPNLWSNGMAELRDYQRRSIDMLYEWFGNNPDGNPCLVLPTGSGKSHIIAAFCKEALQAWPETRILMLTHQKELLEQNSAKGREHWPNAPLGMYSASVGRRQLGEPITFAGIQSVRTKADLIGHVDIVLIDECHLVSHKNEGSYRTLIEQLSAINPNIKIVGLTATPYRLGHGLITDKPALFDDLIEPVSIEELLYKGHLATLRSKITNLQYDLSEVHKRGGEYIESELQAAVDTNDNNLKVAREIIALADDRKHWLLFATGVAHAEHMSAILNDHGVPSNFIHGGMGKVERERIIASFVNGEIKALTNCAVLTTGFDFPNIDLIAMLRPTMSASLYVQMAGRGMRLKSHTNHCLVLDFAGIVAKHGPITAIEPTKKKGKGQGEAPTKICENCNEILHASVRICPTCDFQFPFKEPPPLTLRNDDILGIDAQEMTVTDWNWRKHVSYSSGKEMLAVTYYGGLSDKPITEYITIGYEGYAGQKALKTLSDIAGKSGCRIIDSDDFDVVADGMNEGKMPSMIEYRQDGKYHRVLNRVWN